MGQNDLFILVCVVTISCISLGSVVPGDPSVDDTSKILLCGSYNKPSGFFQSIGYPQYYDNLNCFWNLTVEEDYQVTVEFLGVFQMEKSGSECSQDYVEFFDGPLETSPLIGRFCGYTRPDPITSTSNRLLIRIRTDQNGKDIGFNAHFYQSQPADVTTGVPITTIARETTPIEDSPRPSSSTTRKPSPIDGPGIVINNNNNMFVNFFDWTKFQTWLSTLKPDTNSNPSEVLSPGGGAK